MGSKDWDVIFAGGWGGVGIILPTLVGFSGKVSLEQWTPKKARESSPEPCRSPRGGFSPVGTANAKALRRAWTWLA